MAGAQVLAEFVLPNNQVVRVVRIPDHILSFAIRRVAELNDHVTALLQVRLFIVGVGPGLSQFKDLSRRKRHREVDSPAF
jgi:hypothetical protein